MSRDQLTLSIVPAAAPKAQPSDRAARNEVESGRTRFEELPDELEDILGDRDELECPFELDELDQQDEAEPAFDDRPLPPRDELLASARLLADALSDDLDKPVRLFVTDNRSTMVSFRREKERLVLRVHHMFLGASPEVVKALADYAGRGGRASGLVIDRFVRDNTNNIRIGFQDRRKRLVSSGECCDLKEIYERINLVYFGGRISARIGWGRGVAQRRRRSIRMGVYDHLTRTIRIHPALDRPEVPLFFVEYIVFHEMLHQAVPGKDKGSRREHHGPEFRRQERLYPDYPKALAWEKANLHLLLGRSGIPIRTRG